MISLFLNIRVGIRVRGFHLVFLTYQLKTFVVCWLVPDTATISSTLRLSARGPSSGDQLVSAIQNCRFGSIYDNTCVHFLYHAALSYSFRCFCFQTSFCRVLWGCLLCCFFELFLHVPAVFFCDLHELRLGTAQVSSTLSEKALINASKTRFLGADVGQLDHDIWRIIVILYRGHV